MPELIKFMKETIEPFIKETDPFFEKAFKVSENITRVVGDFNPERVEFKPLEFKEVKRLRIDELQQNIDEYRYLSDKSDNYYSTKETLGAFTLSSNQVQSLSTNGNFSGYDVNKITGLNLYLQEIFRK